jgi:hypothetical protein
MRMKTSTKTILGYAVGFSGLVGGRVKLPSHHLSTELGDHKAETASGCYGEDRGCIARLKHTEDAMRSHIGEEKHI